MKSSPQHHNHIQPAHVSFIKGGKQIQLKVVHTPCSPTIHRSSFLNINCQLGFPQSFPRKRESPFPFKHNIGMGSASPQDEAILVAFCSELNVAEFSVNSVQRSAAAATLKVAGFGGKSIETWLAFLSPDSEEASNSLFTGQLTVG